MTPFLLLSGVIASILTPLGILARRAPEGWEDADGFHYAEPRHQARRDHAAWLAKVLPAKFVDAVHARPTQSFQERNHGA